jgi:hypothetical protein
LNSGIPSLRARYEKKLKYLANHQGILKFVYNLSAISLCLVLVASITSIALLSQHKAYSACFRNGLPDADCDGLADVWEKPPRQYMGINLPSTVNWQHKDILVEIDSMVSHANPNVISAIDQVKNKFATAPGIVNPDGLMGIKLHVLWDDRNIPHDSCTSMWSEFETLLNNWFGTASERLSDPNVATKKKDIYHYGVLIHSICGMTGVSGISHQPGIRFAISLGDAGWSDSDGDGHPDGNTNQKAAAFMHELGHNLNLKHGGSANTPTCKPNYFSVMNHIYEFSGFVPQPLIDYSNHWGRNSVNGIIDENQLAEPYGIVGPSFTGAIGTEVPFTPPHINFQASGSPQPKINYDWWQPDSDTHELDVVSNINHFKPWSVPPNDLCADPDKNAIFGYKDWLGIKYWDPPEDIERISNPLTFNSPELTTTNKIIPVSTNNSVQIQQTLSNQSDNKLLDDPSLPPCDLTEPDCTGSPCDAEDSACEFKVIYNVTDDPTIEIGNASSHPQRDVAIHDIKKIPRLKVFYIDSLLNTSLVNNSQILNSLHKEIINNSDSIVNLIENNAYNNATLKLLKLESLIEMDPTIGMDSLQKQLILREIDEVTNILRSMM